MIGLVAAAGLLAGGAVLAVILPSNRARGIAAILTQALACALVVGVVVPILRGAPAVTGLWHLSQPVDDVPLRVDAVGAFFLAWSLPMTLLGTIYAVGYLQPWFERGRNGAPHFALLNIVALSFLIIYAVQNVLIFLLGWELSAVAAWLLVIWEYRDQKTRFAGFNYLVSTHVGLLVLVAALMYLHGQTDSMDFADFAAVLGVPGGGRSLVFGLVGVAVALKSAFVPVHSWLPRAHAAAPAHVSALMSGVIHKAGLFVLLRFVLLMRVPDEWMGWAVLAMGAGSAVYGVIYACVERDLKRLLGYSSTENVGVVAIGFGVGMLGLAWGDSTLAALGFFAGLVHILGHACFKCLLFYGAGAVHRAAHTVDIERLGGLARRTPATAVLFGIGALAISGLPPLNGFVGEFLLLAGLLDGSAPTAASNAALVCVAALLATVGALSVLSMVRAFGLTFLGTSREPQPGAEGPTVPGAAAVIPMAMLVPMGVLALACVLLGVFPTVVLAFMPPVVGLYGAGTSGPAHLLAVLQSASAGLAGAVVVATGIGGARGEGARRAVTWACGYRLPTRRMQYSASSFSATVAALFATFLGTQTRVRLSRRAMPQRAGSFDLSYVDAVERRIFEVLGRGEAFFVRSAVAVPEEPRFAFAAGLAVLLCMAGWLLSESTL